jgi:hypothetical protein
MLETAVLGMAALGPSRVPAQSARAGIRVEYTAIATQGGVSGRAFLPVGASDVRDGSGERCAGAYELDVVARAARGAVRRIAIRISGPAGRTLTFDGPPCARAEVESELEGGGMLRGGRGWVMLDGVVTEEGGRRALVGHFSQTADLEGTPTTVRGEMRIPLPMSRAPGP